MVKKKQNEYRINIINALCCSYSLQEPMRPLYDADCMTRLEPFQVYDPDGDEYGNVHFEISSDGECDHFN